MCNVPCELCGDAEDCDLYFNQLKILDKLKDKLNEMKETDCYQS